MSRVERVLELFFPYPEIPILVDLCWGGSVGSDGRLEVHALMGEKLDQWEIDYEFERRNGLI